MKYLPFQFKHTYLVLHKRRYVCLVERDFMSLMAFFLNTVVLLID
ncbi:hypothetical protein [Abyssisolibacter fermentans]